MMTQVALEIDVCSSSTICGRAITTIEASAKANAIASRTERPRQERRDQGSASNALTPAP